jgi:hypothetical protein
MSRRLMARGALVVRMMVLEGMRRMKLVVVVVMLVEMMLVEMMLVEMMLVGIGMLVVMALRMMVVTKWFCRSLFVCFLYA